MVAAPHSAPQENVLTIMNVEISDDIVNTYETFAEDDAEVNKTFPEFPSTNDQGPSQGSQIIKTQVELVSKNRSVDDLTNNERVHVDQIRSNSLNVNTTDRPGDGFPATFRFTRTSDLTRNSQLSVSTVSNRVLSATVNLISSEDDENKLDAVSNHGENSAGHNSLECVTAVDNASNAGSSLGCVSENDDSTCVSSISDEGSTAQKWVKIEEFDDISSHKSPILREVDIESLQASWNPDCYIDKNIGSLSFSELVRSLYKTIDQSQRIIENINRAIELNNIPGASSSYCAGIELKNKVESTSNNVASPDFKDIATNILSESEDIDDKDPVQRSDEIKSRTLINEPEVDIVQEAAPPTRTANNNINQNKGNWITSPSNEILSDSGDTNDHNTFPKSNEIEWQASINKPKIVMQETESECFTNNNITSNTNDTSSSFGCVDTVAIVMPESEDVNGEYTVLKLDEMKSACNDSESDAVSLKAEGRDLSEAESIVEDSTLNVVTSTSEDTNFDKTEFLSAESKSDDKFTTDNISSEKMKFTYDKKESDAQSISNDVSHFRNCVHTAVNDVLQSDDIYSGNAILNIREIKPHPLSNETSADLKSETGCTSNEVKNQIGSISNDVVPFSDCCAANIRNESDNTAITDAVPECYDVETNTLTNEPDIDVAHWSYEIGWTVEAKLDALIEEVGRLIRKRDTKFE